MNKMSEKCSTPEFGHKNISLNFSLSEIQLRDSINDQPIRGGSVSEIIKKKNSSTQKKKCQQQEQQRGKNIHDPFSDSEYETVDVREIFYQEYIEDDQINDNIVPENSSSRLSSFQLFRSPARNTNSDIDADYDPPYDLLDDNNIDAPSMSHDPIVSSPEFQLIFRYPTQFKTYARPDGAKKRKLSPSEISFSPKWVNRVPSKYSSPSKIPIGNSSSLSWSLDDYDKSPAKKPIKRTKYTHLQVQSEKFKKLLSPTRKLAQSYKENIKTSKSGANKDRNASKLETSFFANKSHYAHCSKSPTRKKIQSPRYDPQDSAIKLEESMKAKSGLSFVPNRDLSSAGSTVQKKSKPRVVSVEVIKKARISNL